VAKAPPGGGSGTTPPQGSTGAADPASGGTKLVDYIVEKIKSHVDAATTMGWLNELGQRRQCGSEGKVMAEDVT